MRPIKIDDNLKEFAKSFSEDLFKGKRSDFQAPEDKLTSLLSKYLKSTNRTENQIIHLIIGRLRKNLLYLTPTEQQELVDFVDQRFPDVFYRDNKATAFSKEIFQSLRYDELQTKDAWKIADRIKIKTCPYCNAMLAVNVKKKNSKLKARFQLDHFFPKARYPFLSTSFFNLIPCCNNCNQSKSANKVRLGEDFHLYAKETPIDAFKFSIPRSNKDLIRRMIGIRASNIKFQFGPTAATHNFFVKRHDETFAIQQIYETQKDIIEELAWKKQSNYDSKLNELEKILGLSKKEIKRIIVGNYVDYEDIHKRPLSKFMQDIAKDLDLL